MSSRRPQVREHQPRAQLPHGQPSGPQQRMEARRPGGRPGGQVGGPIKELAGSWGPCHIALRHLQYQGFDLLPH
jgi:hypothetical protein